MTLILWLILGALAGWIASKIMRGSSLGLIGNIIVGIVGALIGGWIAALIGLGSFSTFSIAGLLIAVAGACVLLFLIGLFTNKK